jgi:hypothetical protein
MLLENLISAYRKLKLDLCHSPYTIIKSKWINNLNIRSKTVKLVLEKGRNALESIGIGIDFLKRTQMAQQLRGRIDK